MMFETFILILLLVLSVCTSVCIFAFFEFLFKRYYKYLLNISNRKTTPIKETDVVEEFVKIEDVVKEFNKRNIDVNSITYHGDLYGKDNAFFRKITIDEVKGCNFIVKNSVIVYTQHPSYNIHMAKGMDFFHIKLWDVSIRRVDFKEMLKQAERKT